MLGLRLRERALLAVRGRSYYREVFQQRSGPEGALSAACAIVLADLAKFCHAQDTTHVVGDAHGSAQLEGRRQVWLRIQSYLGLTDEQVNRLNEQAIREDGN